MTPMPILSNPKHERFAQLVAQGWDQDKAYAEVGYKPNRFNASRLKTTENVAARIKELVEQVTEKAILDRSWVLDRLMRNAMACLGEMPVKVRRRNKDTGEIEEFEVIDRDPAAANKALELLGKTPELALWVERKEIGGPGDFDRMTPDELERYIRSEAGALGIGLEDASAEARGRKVRSTLN